MEGDRKRGGRADRSQGGIQTAIVWDDSNTRSSTYANVVNVVATREEIMLLFGEGPEGDSGHEEVRVKLKERVVLSPLAAKRPHSGCKRPTIDARPGSPAGDVAEHACRPRKPDSVT